jgi:hypothetical protein
VNKAFSPFHFVVCRVPCESSAGHEHLLGGCLGIWDWIWCFQVGKQQKTAPDLFSEGAFVKKESRKTKDLKTNIQGGGRQTWGVIKKKQAFP